MSNALIERLTSSEFAAEARKLSLEEIRERRGACQSAEEGLSLQRRLVQGRLDIVQAELYRRSGDGDTKAVKDLVAELPAILVEHGDRHLGPGRLTSLDTNITVFGSNFEELEIELNKIVDANRLSNLSEESPEELRSMADQLDQLERTISSQRHQLHRNIDVFQEEIVRRYKSGEASVNGLLKEGD